MEKLQPILRHHFWILFVIALILPPIAWSMTVGTLDEQTQARVDDLDSTLNGVAQGAGAPNADWTTAATQLVNVRKESNRRAWNRLWNVQEQLQIWPATVRPYMENCPYRGTPADLPNLSPNEASRIMATVPNLFREDYEREIERVWRIPEPIDEQTGLKAAKGAPQKVLFPSTVMPRVPRAKWMAAQPTWREMWNAQEDLWLMSELLKAIKRTNADAPSIADANVRQIRQIQLFGGERADPSSSSSSGSSGSPDSTMNPYSGMPGQGRTTTTPSGPASADFSLSEEYTVKDAAASAGGGGYNPMSTATMAEPGSSSGGGNANDPHADENRYIKQEWAYRTRGFKLRVSVHQMYVPTLISELLKSEFPVEIVRFQQSALNPDRAGGSRSGMGAYGNQFASTTGGFAGGPGFPGAGIPGSEAGFPGGTESFPEETPPDGPEGPGAEGIEYDPYSEVSGAGTSGAAAAKNAVNSAIVASALSDVNLMDVVIVGEIYLYNQPDPAAEGEAAQTVAEQTPAGGLDPNGVAPALPPAGADTAAAGLNPAAVPPAASPAALTGEVTPPADNAPVTLQPQVIPATGPDGTAAPASPNTPASLPAEGPADNPGPDAQPGTLEPAPAP